MKNIKKKNIYIPIEIYFREFHQRLYLINKAIKKNFRVYIGTKHGIDKVLRKKIKTKSLGGIYFYKGNIISNKSYLKKIYRCCDNFVALDEEMSPAVPNRDLSLSIRGVFDERISKFFVVLPNNFTIAGFKCLANDNELIILFTTKPTI